MTRAQEGYSEGSASGTGGKGVVEAEAEEPVSSESLIIEQGSWAIVTFFIDLVGIVLRY